MDRDTLTAALIREFGPVLLPDEVAAFARTTAGSVLDAYMNEELDGVVIARGEEPRFSAQAVAAWWLELCGDEDDEDDEEDEDEDDEDDEEDEDEEDYAESEDSTDDATTEVSRESQGGKVAKIHAIRRVPTSGRPAPQADPQQQPMGLRDLLADDSIEEITFRRRRTDAVDPDGGWQERRDTRR